MSSNERRINELLDTIRQGGSPRMNNPGREANRPNLLSNQSRSRPTNLKFIPKQNDNQETDRRLAEIMKISGSLNIDSKIYNTDVKQMEHIEELGNGTCGHVVKMRHIPSDKIIAVKQMRRSSNSEESKRIIMDIDVVLKSHGCKYIVQCLGCFITETEVWICMELMDTCFDKLLKKLKQPIPECVLGKVTVAVVEALSYLKDKHGVIHRDVKPSNILLDTKGNVKLCDFGISGRLVDSLAKTRSAGCAAYMAPERIDPDPENPDYDVRADVWSLGITLVELATGVFPYNDCQTDFEVLTKVLGDDPPNLPFDMDFSDEFRDFVKCCLKKKKEDRPKYVELKNHKFIKNFETANVNVGEWFVGANQQADTLGNRAAPRHQTTNSIRQFFTTQQRQPQITQTQNTPKLTNGNRTSGIKPPQFLNRSMKTNDEEKSSAVKDGRVLHNSRLSSFQSHQKNIDAAHQRATSEYSFHQNTTQQNKSYSPFQAYQNHIAATQNKHESHIPLPQRNLNNSGVENKLFHSPVLQRRVADSPVTSPYIQRRGTSETRWRSPSASPLPLRNQIQTEELQYNHGNTSPIILQRFYHQQKQQQMAKEAEETGKKRFASYIKLQLTGDSGRSSRHQSPEPPPRLNRTISGDNQSPLALRRNFLETHSPNSPSLSKRYVSPTPPVPPPRRLSESTSVPGSPQHLRARFHYTPEPQRRLYQNNDIS